MTETQFKSEDLAHDTAGALSPPHARVRRLETMMLIRTYEERLVELQRDGAPGTCTSVGQKACPVRQGVAGLIRSAHGKRSRQRL